MLTQPMHEEVVLSDERKIVNLVPDAAEGNVRFGILHLLKNTDRDERRVQARLPRLKDLTGGYISRVDPVVLADHYHR